MPLLTASSTTEPSVLSFPYNFISVIQPDFYDAYVDLKELRRQAIYYLNNQKKTAKKIQYIDVPDMPAAVLAYRLYGDSQRDDEIMELNNLYDNMSVSGIIKVYIDV